MNGHFLPIFYDPSKRRWKTFLTTISIVFGLLSIIGYIFTRDFFTTDFITLSPAIVTTQNTLQTQQSTDFVKFNQLKNDVNNIALFQKTSNTLDFKVYENHRYQRMAFYNSWDSDSFKSLEKNIQDIDILITEWLQVKNQQGGDSISRSN